MKELVLKKCSKCNALIKVIEDCKCENCGIKCCDEEMETLIPNQVDASHEKHVPNITKENDEVIITVNHIMEENHYITSITYKSEKLEITKKLNPGDKPELKVPYEGKAKAYAYCNVHSIWEKDID